MIKIKMQDIINLLTNGIRPEHFKKIEEICIEDCDTTLLSKLIPVIEKTQACTQDIRRLIFLLEKEENSFIIKNFIELLKNKVAEKEQIKTGRIISRGFRLIFNRREKKTYQTNFACLIQRNSSEEKPIIKESKGEYLHSEVLVVMEAVKNRRPKKLNIKVIVQFNDEEKYLSDKREKAYILSKKGNEWELIFSDGEVRNPIDIDTIKDIHTLKNIRFFLEEITDNKDKKKIDRIKNIIDDYYSSEIIEVIIRKIASTIEIYAREFTEKNRLGAEKIDLQRYLHQSMETNNIELIQERDKILDEYNATASEYDTILSTERIPCQRCNAMFCSHLININVEYVVSMEGKTTDEVAKELETRFKIDSLLNTGDDFFINGKYDQSKKMYDEAVNFIDQISKSLYKNIKNQNSSIKRDIELYDEMRKQIQSHLKIIIKNESNLKNITYDEKKTMEHLISIYKNASRKIFNDRLEKLTLESRTMDEKKSLSLTNEIKIIESDIKLKLKQINSFYQRENLYFSTKEEFDRYSKKQKNYFNTLCMDLDILYQKLNLEEEKTQKHSQEFDSKIEEKTSWAKRSSSAANLLPRINVSDLCMESEKLEKDPAALQLRDTKMDKELSTEEGEKTHSSLLVGMDDRPDNQRLSLNSSMWSLGRPAPASSDDSATKNGSTAVQQPVFSDSQPLHSSGSSSSLTSSSGSASKTSKPYGRGAGLK